MRNVYSRWAIIVCLVMFMGCDFGRSGKHSVIVIEDSGSFARYEFPSRKELERFIEKAPRYDKLDQFGKPDTDVQKSFQQAERFGAHIKYTFIQYVDKFDFSTLNGRIISMTSIIQKNGQEQDVVTKTFPVSLGQQVVTQSTVLVGEGQQTIQSSSTQVETQSTESLRGKIPEGWKSDKF